METFNNDCNFTDERSASCDRFYHGPLKRNIKDKDRLPVDCGYLLMDAWAKYHEMLAGWMAPRCKQLKNAHFVRSEDLIEKAAWPRVVRMAKQVMALIGRPKLATSTITSVLSTLSKGRLHKRNKQAGSYGRWRAPPPRFDNLSSRVRDALAQFDYPRYR